MKHFIVFLAILALPAIAQDVVSAPSPVEDWEQLRVQATELRSRAKQMRIQADKTRVDAETFCREKILVASCLDDAKKGRQEAERAIQRMELEALGMERRVRVHDHEVKLERRAERNRGQEIKAAERAEEIRQKDERRRLKQERQQAEEERRLQKARRE